jgi:hypothetical protein
MVCEGVKSTSFAWTNKGVEGGPSLTMTASCGTDESLTAYFLFALGRRVAAGAVSAGIGVPVTIIPGSNLHVRRALRLPGASEWNASAKGTAKHADDATRPWMMRRRAP